MLCLNHYFMYNQASTKSHCHNRNEIIWIAEIQVQALIRYLCCWWESRHEISYVLISCARKNQSHIVVESIQT